MSDTPKFEVIDRRKMKAEEEKKSGETAAHVQQEVHAEIEAAERELESMRQEGGAGRPAASVSSQPSAGPRLVVNEAKSEAVEEPEPPADETGVGVELPPPPTAEESKEQKAAYDASAQRLEDLIRAQNPAAGQQPPVGFEHLVQQLYLTAMLQMGAGTQEGQRPRVDIVGARNTIDLLGTLAEKTRGNLTSAEDRMLQTVLFEARMAFLELTSMMTMQPMPPPPPAGKK